MKQLSRKKIQDMIDLNGANISSRRSSGGSGAGGGGGVSSAWVDEHYVSKDFFARLFTINGTDENDDDVVVEPNDLETTITNIQAMVGLWTEEYLSALGQGSGGGGGGGALLTEPLASINEAGMGTPSGANKVIAWNGSTWTYMPYTTGSGTVTSVTMTVPTGFKVSNGDSQTINNSGTFALTFGGTITKNQVLASPAAANGTPAWRALVADDIPDLSSTYVKATDLAAYTWWGRTLQTSGQTKAVYGDIENAANIKIDNDKKISWKQHGQTNYLSMLTLDTSNNFVVGESMANSGLSTYIRGRSVVFQSGTGNSGSHSATLDANGVLTVEKLVIGSITIEHDTTNGGLHIVNAGIYADKYSSALGAGSGGGGGGALLTEPLASINEAGMGTPSGANKVIAWNGSTWTYMPYTTGSGTVTSVTMTVPTGFKVSNGDTQTINNSGTFALTFASGYSLPTTAKQTNWDTAYGNFDTNGNAKSALKLTTVSKTAWGRTYWTSGGVPDSISGDIENAANIKIDNDKRVSWKKSGADNYLSMLTLDSSNNFIVGEAMANEGLTTYVRGRSINFQTGTGSSGNHGASMSDAGLFSVEKLRIGSIVISEDTQNGGLHVESAGLYADTYLSSLGAGSGGGSGSGITMNDVWDALAATAPSASSQQINLTHLTTALSSYASKTWVQSQGFVTTDTKNTAGNFDIYGAPAAFPIYLVGTQGYSGNSGSYGATFVNHACYIDTNNCLYSNGTKVLTSVPTASSTVIGGIKVGYTTSGKNYAVQLDSNKAYVNVPWENDDTKNTAGNFDIYGTPAAFPIYLVGTKGYSGNSGSYGATFVNHACYIDTNNCLYSNGSKVLTSTSGLVTTNTTQTISGTKTFSSIAALTFTNGASNRVFSINNNGAIKLDVANVEASSGWEAGYYAKSGNTYIGCLGLFGVGTALDYAFIGKGYDNTWLTVKSNGNVGIGTNITNPSTKLHVDGIGYFTSGVTVGGFDQYHAFYVNGNTKLSGLVGIGTSAQSGYRLYVNGDTYFNGKSYFASDIYIYCMNNNIYTATSGHYYTISVGAANHAVIDYAWVVSSDMRRKDVVMNAGASIEQIAKSPIFYYRLKGSPETTLALGSSAQYWQQVFPNAISENPDGFLSMDYSAIALASAVITARTVQNHEERILELERENMKLRKEIELLKAA